MKIEIRERDMQLRMGLVVVQDQPERLLSPNERLAVVVAALDRALSLREMTELVEAAHQSIGIVLKAVTKNLEWSGWHGAWCRCVKRESPAGWRRSSLFKCDPLDAVT